MPNICECADLTWKAIPWRVFIAQLFADIKCTQLRPNKYEAYGTKIYRLRQACSGTLLGQKVQLNNVTFITCIAVT